MAAHQTPLSLGFSRQEHWSGLPFPSPMHESESESEVAQLYPTFCNPMDCSLPGSSVHGIFQARVLEWGAIAFSISNHSSALFVNFPIWKKKKNLLFQNRPILHLIPLVLRFFFLKVNASLLVYFITHLSRSLNFNKDQSS